MRAVVTPSLVDKMGQNIRESGKEREGKRGGVSGGISGGGEKNRKKKKKMDEGKRGCPEL